MACPAAAGRRRERPPLELADVFRQCGEALQRFDGSQTRVVRAILDCRTAALGGHVEQCDHCDHRQIAYNSCRNRHCPKCQGRQQRRWIEAQLRHLLPVEYHHVVFTVPETLHPLFRAHPRRAYALLFAAVAETLRDAARSPRNLGAKIGFSCVLHTWTQTLLYHPHIHCIVTGGGLDPERRRFVPARRGFLFHVRILARLFRGKLLRRLERGLDDGSLRTAEDDPRALLRAAAGKDWVVYSKPPLAGPAQVLRYLGRYTHRVAISNHRLLELQAGRVTFRWNDRLHHRPNRRMTLDAAEFVRRFLLHLLPSRARRIRHYGLLANPTRRRDLALCRRLIDADRGTADRHHATATPHPESPRPREPIPCPRCRIGQLVVILQLPPTSTRSP